MKAITIISRALRLCRIVDAGEALNADEAQDALATLNAMLAEWYEAGIGLPQYTFDTLQTDLATDAGDSEAMAYQLAMRIAPEYDADLPALVIGMAESAMGRMRLRYFQPGNTDLTELPSESVNFNITTGDY